MGLTDADRKRLWAGAGNRCSYRFQGDLCNKELVFADGDKAVNIGVECHIVGEKPTAARYIDDFPDRDAASNRILLCGNHHTIIDNNPELYTIEVLHEMKAAHEQAIRAATGTGVIPPIVIRDAQLKKVTNDFSTIWPKLGKVLRRDLELSLKSSTEARVASGPSVAYPLIQVHYPRILVEFSEHHMQLVRQYDGSLWKLIRNYISATHGLTSIVKKYRQHIYEHKTESYQFDSVRERMRKASRRLEDAVDLLNLKVGYYDDVVQVRRQPDPG